MENQLKNGVSAFWLKLFFALSAFSLIYLATLSASKAFVKIPEVDSVLSKQLKTTLSSNSLSLNFPLLTSTFYRENNSQAVWSVLVPQKSLWDAMMLLDCSLQYGLSNRDYHNNWLNYTSLQSIAPTKKIDDAVKFEILLTDAMITLINQLHYGKANPTFTTAALEKSDQPFADSILTVALQKNLVETIISVQPSISDYRDLQLYLRLITGQYVGDSYESSEGTIRLLAANLERLRWEKHVEPAKIVVNIPSYLLRYNEIDDEIFFKVIVGEPGNSTPLLISKITHFTTAPEWAVPDNIFRNEILPKALKDPSILKANNYQIYDKNGKAISHTYHNLKLISLHKLHYHVKQSPGCKNALGNIVFRFDNPYDIYLHDTPNKKLFGKTERALSHGCIRLDNPEKLAELLLQSDGTEALISDLRKALSSSSRKTFILKTPVTIAVRYLTCQLENSILISYDDIYHRDQPLSEVLLGKSTQFIVELKEFANKKQADVKIIDNSISLKN